MQMSDVQRLVDLGPRDRAVQALALGAELGKQRKKRYPKALRRGNLPRSFHESHVGAAQTFLTELHGIPQPDPGKITGFQQIGSLATVLGRTRHVVQTSRRRKAQSKIAMSSARGERVADVAERQLMLLMLDCDPFARMCGAYGYWQATGATHVAMPILAKGLKSKDVEEFEVAATCLGHMGTAAARELRPWVGTEKDDRQNSPTLRPKPSMTVIIHGTFAKNASWYKPRGSFHRYIKNQVFSDLYSGQDHFFWSGRYSDSARRSAAKKLVKWCAKHPATTLRLIAHSHGANVVNLATRMGLQACTLIHLSPPVHDRYMPDMNMVSSGRLHTIRPRIDLVVLIDGGARDYRNTPVAQFERRKISAVFGHSTSHERKHWKKKNVSKFVKKVCP